jgi:CBS domain-containing protein
MNLVQHILDDARRRLAVLSREALISEAAEILANPDTPLVVVCDGQGIAVGVVSKTDIMKALARARADAIKMNAGAIMTHAVLSCHVDQTLPRVWESMNARSLHDPVIDSVLRVRQADRR